MAASSTFAFNIVARSTRSVVFSLYEDDGTTAIVAQVTDQARFKLWLTDDDTPTLDLSKTATANGSSCTITTSSPCAVTVKFAQGDTAISAGRYKAELGFVDDSETVPADAYTAVATGYVTVVGSATGDRDLE